MAVQPVKQYGSVYAQPSRAAGGVRRGHDHGDRIIQRRRLRPLAGRLCPRRRRPQPPLLAHLAGPGGPNRVVIIETFDTREYAEQIFTSETTHKTMTADGVDLASLTVEYLDEAA